MALHLVLARAAWLLLAVPLAQEQEVLPGDSFERLSEPLRKCLASLDPRVDQWTSEARSGAAALQLEKIAEALRTNAPESDALLGGVFASDFRARLPARLEDALVDEAFRVRTPAQGGEELTLDPAAFLQRLAGSVAGARDVRAEFEIVGVGLEDAGLVTQAVFDLSGRLGQLAVQSSSWWECRWREDPGGKTPPELASVRFLDQAEVEGKGPVTPLFSDKSASVFGANPAWEAQLVSGLSSWRARLDTRLGLPLIGHAAGIALGDVDGDGLEDLYLCQPGGLPNKLFLHRSDGTVVDRSAEAGVDFLDVSRSALLVDLDQDGDRDLVVNAADRLLLLANDGHARFWLQSALEVPDSTSLAAADVDLDGDLDLYACAYASPYDHSTLPVPYHDAVNGERSKLFENHGDWIFVDATAERGLDAENRFSSSASFEDYDLDGDPDLYVANDFGRDDLFRNDGGTFRDVSVESGAGDVSAGTGVSWGDHDGDGRFDLYVSSVHSSAGNRIAGQERFHAGAPAEVRAQYRRHARGNALYRNQGDGTFRDVTPASPLSAGMGGWAWGALFADVNGDGWQDLLSPNGFLTEELDDDLGSFFWRQVVAQSPLDAAPAEGAAASYRTAWTAFNLLLRRGHSWSGRERNRAFLNLRGAGFAGVSAATGFDSADDARAMALVDWDGDGDLDVFLTCRTGPRVRYLQNDQGTSNASVTLELRGTRANRDAIGARVELTVQAPGGAARTLLRAVRAGEGHLAQSSARLTIGLGAGAAKLARVQVTWPGGEKEVFTGVERGQAWRLVQGSGRAEPLALVCARPPAPPTPVAPPTSVAVRVPLVRPVTLPRLEVSAEDGESLPLFGLKAGGEGSGTGKPVLLELFSTSSVASARQLDELASHASDLAREGLAPLALSVEGVEGSGRAAAFLRERNWPFPWATSSPAALELLDALQCILLDRERRLPLPASFLVDAQGALRVLYLGPVTSAQLLADRELCELGEGALFDASTPFPGRWMFAGLPSDADFFEGRLRARGLGEAAAEFARARMTVVRSAPADLLQDFGRQSAVAGRLEEAEKFFRRALTADPRHFAALFDLAVVLQREERLSEARELYGKALALRPEHADAHFNLALVQIAQGDLAGAERELRWLKAHGLDDLEGLEGALAARKKSR